jgi:CDP-diacylglycerol--glycerol-3-phosphate 3-phosphatidyltransferase
MDLSLAKIFTVPNLVSLSRIFMVPFISAFMAQGTTEGNLWAAGLLILAIFTDFLDGLLARLLNQKSDLGRLMDPFADKLFIIWFVIVLIQQRDFPIWLAVIYVLKDLLIIAASLSLIGKKDAVAESNIFGKYAFVFQASVVVSYFLHYPFGIWSGTYLSLIFIVLTLFSYGNVFLSMKRGAEPFRFQSPSGRSLLTWGRRAGILLYSVTYLALLIPWAFENSELTSQPSWQIDDVAIELIAKHAPVLSFAPASLLPVDAENYFEKEFVFLSESKQPIVYVRPLILGEEENDIALILQYWFLFPSEQKPVKRNGDWQLYSVFIDSSDQVKWTMVTSAWNALVVDGEQRELFVGAESNNFYFETGEQQIFIDNEGVISAGSEQSGGARKLSIADYEIQPMSTDSAWLKYSGRWGGGMPASDRGPAFWNAKSSQLSPWVNPLGFLEFYRSLQK